MDGQCTIIFFFRCLNFIGQFSIISCIIVHHCQFFEFLNSLITFILLYLFVIFIRIYHYEFILSYFFRLPPIYSWNCYIILVFLNFCLQKDQLGPIWGWVGDWDQWMGFIIKNIIHFYLCKKFQLNSLGPLPLFI